MPDDFIATSSNFHPGFKRHDGEIKNSNRHCQGNKEALVYHKIFYGKIKS
jgi:hypothetical protein